MKKFLLKVLLFFACIEVMDLAFGQFFSILRTHAKGGSTANCDYIANRATDDVIILGSSRATHHYVPQIIEDSLGVSCYNCGEEGNGVVLAYGRLKMLTNRYKPKLVIYEITPGYDYGTVDPNNKYLGYLRPYYDKEGISQLFDDFDDELSWLKMHSKMYQNTGRLLPDLIDNIIFRDNQKGYAPLNGVMVVKKTTNAKIENTFTIDSLKLNYVEKVIELCQSKDIPIVFMISPWFNYNSGMAMFNPAFKLCEKYGIDICSMIDEPNISTHAEFFNGANHLNHAGAIEYTKNIIPIIKNNIIASNQKNE